MSQANQPSSSTAGCAMLIALVVVALFWFHSYGNSSSEDSASQTLHVAHQPSLLSVSATDICLDYSSNEISADEKYKDKIITVTGEVVSVDVPLDKPLVDLNGGNGPAVFCYFQESDKHSLAGLNAGQTVTIKGLCSGAFGGDPTLNNCVVTSN